MGKTNLNKYRPREDSSPGTEGIRTRMPQLENDVILVVRANDCLCGCTQPPAGTKSKFRMGHDARYRGKLIRAHVTGTKITIINSTTNEEDPLVVVSADPMALAKEHGWSDYLTIAAEREDARTKQKADRASQTLLEKVTGERVGDEKLIKVGRWEYTGQVVAVFEVNDGKEIVYRYVTKNGETKEHRVMSKKAEVA